MGHHCYFTRGLIGAIALSIAGCSTDVGDLNEGSGDTEAVATSSEALSPLVSATWYQDSMIEGTPVHRAGTNTLDQLLIHVSGQPGRWHRDSSGVWTFEYITGAPAGVVARALAGAYSGGIGDLEVFVHGSDGNIYWTYKQTDIPGSTWATWDRINDDPSTGAVTSVKGLSKVAVANRGVGALDVFWVTNSSSNTLGHVKIDGFSAAAPVSGSSTRPWLQSANGAFFGEVRAIAWDANRVDVFALAGNRIQHVWRTGATSWHTSGVLNREVIISSHFGGPELIPHGITVSSRAPGVIDVIALMSERGFPLALAKTQYNGSWIREPGRTWVTWNPMHVSPSGTSLPPKLFGATYFKENGTGKVNLIGGGATNLDQFDAYIFDP